MTDFYARVYLRFLEDRRTHAAARRLAQSEKIPEEWAVPCVLGLLAEIDAWLVSRGPDGEKGELPDDGLVAIRSAASLSPAAARSGLAALLHGKWLVRRSGVTVRVDFIDDYGSLFRARNTARAWREERRGLAPPRPPGVSHGNGTRSIRVPFENDTRRGVETERAVDVGVDSRDLKPAVDVMSTAVRASPPGRAATPAATAPRGKAAPTCALCRDGLVRRRGRKPRCCACPRGRERARGIRFGVIQDEQHDERLRAHRLEAKRRPAAAGVDAETVGAVADRVLADLKSRVVAPSADGGA